MKFLNLAFLAALVGGSLAEMHDYCACQFFPNSKVSPTATSLVAMDCSTGYEYSNSDGLFWVPGYGVRFQGRYLRAKSGRIHDKTFHDTCVRHGGGDSTCFNCGTPQYNPDNSILCNR
ncbi:Hypothetical protein D9617_18g032770 [Elsinoe fawcettii]|nr:Hypothetical protein D9617_18g032770 [Elsinoe fawcettii]